jgi:predicted site-specific integrase-resolvase
VRKTNLYGRVRCHDQKADLEPQKQRLLAHAGKQGWINVEAITDLGSGMNCRKAGLLRLLGMVVRRDAERVVVENKDRLLRFGTELLAWLCAWRGCDLVVVEQANQRSPEETWRVTCSRSSRNSPRASMARGRRDGGGEPHKIC